MPRMRARWARSDSFLARWATPRPPAATSWSWPKNTPDDYVPFLALGDLYSADRQFPEAQESYQQAFQRSSSNPLIISGAMNAALEAHHLDQAKEWPGVPRTRCGKIRKSCASTSAT